MCCRRKFYMAHNIVSQDPISQSVFHKNNIVLNRKVPLINSLDFLLYNLTDATYFDHLCKLWHATMLNSKLLMRFCWHRVSAILPRSGNHPFSSQMCFGTVIGTLSWNGNYRRPHQIRKYIQPLPVLYSHTRADVRFHH